MRRHLAALISALALGATLTPGVADASEPLVSDVYTTATVNDIGRYTASAVAPDGTVVTAALDATTNSLEVISCADTGCVNGSQTTVTSGVWSHFDIAVGRDGLPVLVVGTYWGLSVIKCGDIACSSGNTITPVGPQVNAGPRSILPSIDVRSDNTPIIAYNLPIVPFGEVLPIAAGVRVLACDNPACSGGDYTITSWADDGWNFYPDVAVDPKDQAFVVWSEFAWTTSLLRCATASCDGGSVSEVADNMERPEVAASDGIVSLVGYSSDGLVRVDCTKSCGSKYLISDPGHEVVVADIAFVGGRRSVVSYVADDRGVYVIDCVSKCLDPERAARGAGFHSISVAGGDGQAFVSYQQYTRRDVGLVWVHRPSQSGW